MSLFKDAIYGKELPVNAGEARMLIAHRVRRLRIHAGWSQVEISRRAGLPFETYRRFESNGQLQLDRLCNIAMVLGRLKDFSSLFEPPPAQSLAELKSLKIKPRQRGRTLQK